MRVFQTAFNVANEGVSEAFSLFYGAAAQWFPVVEPWQAPSTERVDELDRLAQQLGDHLRQLGMWVHDYRVEMQHAMLAELFPNDVTRRDPIDPRHLVITLERHKELERYFEFQTPWGRRLQAAKEAAKEAAT